MTPEDMTKDQRSILLYAESCLVDQGGLLEGQRMNGDDLTNLKKFQDEGLLTWGRIPASHLGMSSSPTWKPTNWVAFNDAAWALAHACRQRMAEHKGPYATCVFAEVAARKVPA